LASLAHCFLADAADCRGRRKEALRGRSRSCTTSWSSAGTQGWTGVLTQMGWFFTKVALLTFGGAYAVLPCVYQGAVEHYRWLTGPQMIDGLALGETTPGPLIESTHGNLGFTGPLTAIAAAVVGVIPVVIGSGLAGLVLQLAGAAPLP